MVDASVVLAWLQDEPGSDEAEPMLMEGVIGAANWSEVLQKSRARGISAEVVAGLLASFGLSVEPVIREDGERASALWRAGTRLSLADRLCLALGLRMDAKVATMDGSWAGVPVGPEVVVLR